MRKTVSKPYGRIMWHARAINTVYQSPSPQAKALEANTAPPHSQTTGQPVSTPKSQKTRKPKTKNPFILLTDGRREGHTQTHKY